MGIGKSAPKAPDPKITSMWQNAANIGTAQVQQLLNMTNQVGPWGSTTYNPTGSTQFTDAFGKTHTIPTYTQTTEYSPEQQAIFDKTTQAQTNLADLAIGQSDNLKSIVENPFEFNNQDAANWAYDLAQQRIAPQQEQQRQALESRLINSGIRPGTAAYEREMMRFGQNVTDQNNQLALTGRQQAFNEQLQTRGQAFNEMASLLTGSQIQGPNTGFSATPQSSVAGVDYTGLVNQKYQADLANYQAQMGGMFGLAGAGIMAASDERLKTDIKRVGRLDNGLPVYSYRYKAGGPPHIGLMAQDVMQVNPEAVGLMEGGFLAVDYAKAVQ